MCYFTTLSYNEKNGYIVHCTSCDKLQLAFGCVVVHFDRQEFYSFKRVMESIVLDYEGETGSDVKSITVPTPCDGLQLYLSSNEVRIIFAMADEAETHLKTNDLLQLFAS